MKGKLIVIEGVDGSGKSTQVKWLFNYLKRKKIPVKTISFPRYGNVYGKVIRKILTSQWGKYLSPYIVALPFALDRRAARRQMLNWLKEGELVIVDRYVWSSMAHQGAKFEGEKQARLLRWVYNLEYKTNQLVKENVVIFLSLSAKASQKLIQKRVGSKGKRDLVDLDAEHQQKVVGVYEQLAKRYSHWRVISCVDRKEELRSKSEVHKEMVRVLQEEKII